MAFWSLHAHDLGLFAFRNRPDVQRCPQCKEIVDKWSVTHENLTVSNADYDVGATYDGLFLVGAKFQCIYKSNNMHGLDFLSTASRDWKWIRTGNRVQFDAIRRRTRFFDYCEICNSYKQVIGANPVFLKEDVAGHQFAWTDIEFAHSDEKSPVLLCGDHAGSILQNENLNGIVLRRHDDEYVWPFLDAQNTIAFITKQAALEGLPILSVWHDAEDGAWQFLCETTNDEDDLLILSLGEVAKLDSTVLELADLPLDWKACRTDRCDPWKREPQ